MEKDNVQLDFEKAYPEHAKLERVKYKSQWPGEFLSFLGDRRYIISQWEKEEKSGKDVLVQRYHSINEWLSEFLDIDFKKLDLEKDKMLEEFRKQIK